MKAISIRQPWAWAICRAGKRVENREWRTVPRYRGPLLIHAAKGCTADEHEGAAYFMRDIARAQRLNGGPWPDDLTKIPGLKDMARGAIVARARLVEVVHIGEMGHAYEARGSVLGNCRNCGSDERGNPRCPKPDPWAIPGALGLILADVVPLAVPVPFKGALGFFEVPDELIGGAS